MKYLGRFAVLMALVGIGGLAQAQGGYVAGFVGRSDIDEYGFDDKTTSYRIGGGYRVNPNFAVEAYYVDYGEAEDNILGLDVSLEASAFQLQALGILPLHPSVALYGKLGVTMWDAKACAEVLGCEDETGNDPVYGLGLTFSPVERLGVSVEYEEAEFDDVEEIDVHTLMVGLSYAF